ncbi:hypothetical protein KW782_01140 [Candidatus Parcubacteria bacterium]|nr:hypothetical protein [Candidatus Parcubacteria bacterium]
MSKKNPLISVCIPTYEMHGLGAKFLKYNFDILLKQTFTDFNVVISDYSKDSAIRDVCNAYKDKLSIEYHKNNDPIIGMCRNFNNVIKHGTGKILKLLCLDDFLYGKDALAVIAKNFDLNKDTWLVTACIHTKNGWKFFRPFYPKYNQKIHLGRNTISSPSVLTIKNQNPLLFDVNLKWYMDVDYYKRCYDKFGEPKIVNTISVVNRIGRHQTSQTEITNELVNHELDYVGKKFNEKTTRDVTLVAVSGIDPTSGMKALEISMQGMRFHDVVLISHTKPENLNPKITFKQCKPGQLQSKDPKNKNDYSKFMAYHLWEYIDSDYIIIVHNNAYILRPHKWDYEFLKYDYIGAPWPKNVHFTNEGVNVRVGNGGFSLRSKRMLRILHDMNLPFTDNGTGFYNEDGIMCVYYRKQLEDAGIKFAPVSVAAKFSCEKSLEDSDLEPFGFHDNKKVMPRFFMLKFRIKKLLGRI